MSTPEQIKWIYFQFRKSHDYPIYIRFKETEFNQKFNHVFNEIGFVLLTEQDSRKIKLHRHHTRILTVQEASPRFQLQINGSNLLDVYGPESLALQQGLPIYTYRKVGMMGVPASKSMWDLVINPDIAHTDQMVGMRVILVRFLAQALAAQGILCYWGTTKDDTVIIMKQAQSFGEAVLIDLEKRIIFSPGGEMKLGSSLKIIRKDKDSSFSHLLTREETISFLSVSTCLLSFNGITPAMKKNIYDLSTFTSASFAVSETSVNL